jgi:hypothetical protein
MLGYFQVMVGGRLTKVGLKSTRMQASAQTQQLVEQEGLPGLVQLLLELGVSLSRALLIQ